MSLVVTFETRARLRPPISTAVAFGKPSPTLSSPRHGGLEPGGDHGTIPIPPKRRKPLGRGPSLRRFIPTALARCQLKHLHDSPVVRTDPPETHEGILTRPLHLVPENPLTIFVHPQLARNASPRQWKVGARRELQSRAARRTLRRRVQPRRRPPASQRVIALSASWCRRHEPCAGGSHSEGYKG